MLNMNNVTNKQAGFMRNLSIRILLASLTTVNFVGLAVADVSMAAPISATPPPANPAEAPMAFSCKQFMSIIAKKRVFNCDVKGQAHGFGVDYEDVASPFSASRGSGWKYAGKSGVESNYAVGLGTYTIDLFKLEVAPLPAQVGREVQVKVEETCTAERLKIVSRVKANGEAWGAPEVVEMKRNLGNPRYLSVSISKPDISLSLRCN